MNSESTSNKRLLLLTGLIYLLAYIIFFPDFIFISDELSYLQLANNMFQVEGETIKDAISSQVIDFKLLNYPLGTSTFFKFGYTLLGSNGMYLINCISLLLSFSLIVRMLNALNKNIILALFVFAYPASIIFSRLLMSETLSLLFVSLFLFLITKKEIKYFQLFLIGFLCTFVCWFREAAIILTFFPFLFFLYSKKTHKERFLLLFGFLIGALPRLISSAIIYDNPLFIKDPVIAFSMNAIFDNVTIYAIIFLVFFPLSIYFFGQIKKDEFPILKITALVYILFHLSYGYNAIERSGVKGILLISRFFIPLIPFYIIAISPIFDINKLQSKISRIAIFSLTNIFIIATHFSFDNIQNNYDAYQKKLEEIGKGKTLFISSHEIEIQKILLPYFIEHKSTAYSVTHFNSSYLTNQLEAYDHIYYLSVKRNDSKQHLDKAKLLNKHIIEKFKNCHLTPIFKTNVPGKQITIEKISIK